MSTTPYWLDGPANEFPPIDSRGRTEVAVIGGGVTGCSCALTLAERGVRVRVYEQRAGRTPDEVAEAICELSRREPRTLNGQTFRVGAL